MQFEKSQAIVKNRDYNAEHFAVFETQNSILRR